MPLNIQKNTEISKWQCGQRLKEEWVKEESTKEIRKYLEENENENAIY